MIPNAETANALAPTSSALGGMLAQNHYRRARVQPWLRDLAYLYMTDLLLVTRQFARETTGDLFDYGCGGAPYREAFAHCHNYVRADVTPGPGIDRLLPPDGRTAEPDNSYDTVLSSQVLEHVREPAAYLAECARLLRPGGRLILTTHGLFEEHGCPFDFYRWTGYGLEAALAPHGFKIRANVKVTSGLRGIIQMQHFLVAQLRAPSNRPLNFCLGVVRRLYRWVGYPVLNWLAKRLTRDQIVPATDPSAIYIGIAVLAEKV